MSINLNTNPYYDDFDEGKNFHRVLFKPGVAVQARELTQLQTILQSQIERFGRHVFREGSIVIGGNIGVETNVPYVKLANGVGYTDNDLESLIGMTITGSVSGVEAYIYEVATATEWGNTEDILMLKYTASSETSDKFIAGEPLVVTGSTISLSVFDTEPTGVGSVFTIDDGVVFSRGFFVAFAKQRIVLDPTSTTPTCQIGFESSEKIVTANADQSLLDNAQGSPNFGAPGADRLAIIAQLERFTVDEVLVLPDFVSLFTVKDGVIINVKDKSEYNKLADELARRTFNESGDYVVRGFGVRVREHLDTGSNEGFLTDANGGDENLLVVGVEPGVGYVKGYEVNNLATKTVTTPKSTDFSNVNGEVVLARSGSYLLCDELVGNLLLDTAPVIAFYNTAGERVTNKVSAVSGPAGTLIGTARVKHIARETANVYRVYLFDMKFNTGYSLANARNLYASGFSCDPILEGGIPVLKEIANTPLLYSLGSNFVRNVRDENGDIDTSFTFTRAVTGINIATNGTFSITVTPTLETHSYGTSGTLGTTEKSSIILTLNTATSIPLTGTVSGTSGQKNLSGVGTSFTRFNNGDRITISGVPGTYTVENITSDLAMSLVEPLTSSPAGAAYQKAYIVGDVIDLNGKGVAAGATRDVTVTNNKTLSFNLQESYGGTLNAVATISVTRSTSKEITKVLRPNRYVMLSGSWTAGVSKNLGFSDVYRIREVRASSSAFTTGTEGTDVTSQFLFNNGQRDDIYDQATLTAKSTIAGPHFLVKLDYFSPDFTQGVGYFSVDSYPIDDDLVSDTTIFTHEIPVYKSPNTGAEYNLRNYLDFRPVKLSTATDATTIAAASTNPAASSSIAFEANGLRIPVPSSQVYTDYTYYLARRDVVALNKTGDIVIVNGIPSISPLTPDTSDTVMAIAVLTIPPYPSLSTTWARILGKETMGVTSTKVSIARHTMRDIGVLKQRIENLEYYNALTLLEKSAVDLQVTDETGLDRFKNGFFVDGFVDHSLGATTNASYNIAVDSRDGVIRPVFETRSIKMIVDNSINIRENEGGITVPYTESLLIEQNRVTTTRNIEQSVFRFVGNMTVSPDTDSWVDTTTVDRTITTGDSLPNSLYMNTNWNSWEEVVLGYNVYQRQFGNRNDSVNGLPLIGSYDSLYAATRAAYSSERTKLETLSQDVRTGTKTTIDTIKETNVLGNFVTDVSVQPYIRPQILKLHVRGLKARTRYYVFFDGEDMADYSTQVTEAPAGSASPFVYGTEGDTLRSDTFGDITILLRLPATGKRFRVGTKEIIVTDNPTNSVDASSYSKGYFVANGLAVSKQNTILSTKTPIFKQEILTERGQVEQKVEIFGPSCMAYSFKVEVPQDQVGCFVTSADVFVASTHPTLGFWVEIREMNTGGGITRTQVPNSEVWFEPSQITTTSDGTTPHKITFPSPVFLFNDTQYAFVIHTVGLNPDTYFWISRLGETDKITNKQVTARQLTGNVFTTNNNLNWDIVPDIDLKFNLHRADFTRGGAAPTPIGSVTFKNAPVEFIQLASLVNNFSRIGEAVYGSDILTLSAVGGTINVGDQLQIGSLTATVVDIDGANYKMDGVGYVVGNVCTVLDSLSALKGFTATVESATRGSAKLEAIEGLRVELVESNGKFFVGGKVYSSQTTPQAVGVIASFDEYKYSVASFAPKVIELQGTQTLYEYKALRSGALTYSNFTFCSRSTYVYDEEYTLRSASVENGTPSIQFRAIISSESGYVSPLIDPNNTTAVLVHNIINDDLTNETNPTDGKLINKYISKTVTLADGQDAEDMMVVLTAYRPPSSNIKVWAKIRHVDDPAIIDEKSWIELVPSVDQFSSVANKQDFKEIRYTFDPAIMTGANGSVRYTVNGANYDGYRQFIVKIGLVGTNSAIVPKVGDLRVLALQL